MIANRRRPLLAWLLARPAGAGLCGSRRRLTDEESQLPIEGYSAGGGAAAPTGRCCRARAARTSYDDPFEDVNQVFFYLNGALDFLFLEPIAQFYRGMMPTDARHALSRAFTNLAEPMVADQPSASGLEPAPRRHRPSAGSLVNSTAGVAGPLRRRDRLWGFEAVDADFGQTLHHYGISQRSLTWCCPSSAPTTVRDAVGLRRRRPARSRAPISSAPRRACRPCPGRRGRAPRGGDRGGQLFLRDVRRRSLRRGARLELPAAPARAHRRLHRAQVRDLPRLLTRVSPLRPATSLVMPGLVPGIHVLCFCSTKTRGWPQQVRT